MWPRTLRRPSPCPSWSPSWSSSKKIIAPPPKSLRRAGRAVPRAGPDRDPRPVCPSATSSTSFLTGVCVGSCPPCISSSTSWAGGGSTCRPPPGRRPTWRCAPRSRRRWSSTSYTSCPGSLSGKTWTRRNGTNWTGLNDPDRTFRNARASKSVDRLLWTS